MFPHQKNEIEHGKTKNRKIDVTSLKLISMNLSNKKKNHQKKKSQKTITEKELMMIISLPLCENDTLSYDRSKGAHLLNTTFKL